MIYGYARVSTTAQDLATQIGQLKAEGCEAVFHDRLSGLTTKRPELGRLLKTVRPGDTVVNSAADRLSRDAADLLTIARDLKAGGVGLRSIAEPIIDTSREFADLVLAVLGLAAKLEHKRLRERTAAGREKAKADGVRFGAKPKLTPHQQREAVQRRDEDGEPMASIARSFNVNRQTISRLR